MIDIIIVNYNSTDCLLKCLETVYIDLNGASATVFIVDNGSSEDIFRITAMFPEVVLLSNSKNLGFAAAVNQALKKTTAAFVVLLNPDSYLKKGFLNTVIPFMEDNSSVAIVGPRILNRNGSVQGSARSFPTPLTAFFGRSSLLTRWFPKNRLTRANVLVDSCGGIYPIEVDWVSGACMIVRRKAIEAIGYFDERFFMYWEDADWCHRMRKAGWKIIYFPLAEITHYAGISSRKRPLMSQLEFHKSAYRLFDKYSPSSPWLLKIMVLSTLFLRFCLLALFQTTLINTRK